MANRILALLLACLFSVTVAGPGLLLAAGSAGPDSASAHHEDGAPCPDGDDQGPCDPGCSCLCCPGHAPVQRPAAAASLVNPLLAMSHDCRPPDAFHPEGVFYRIFRPPRV